MASVETKELRGVGNIAGVDRKVCKCCNGSFLQAVKSSNTKETLKIAEEKSWSCLDSCIDKNTGDTPLIVALKAGDKEMSSFLYRNGADQFNRNHKGENALDLSKDSLLELLQKDIHQPEPDNGARISP